MEDIEVVRAFVNDDAKRAFGPTLHIEGDGLFLDGWWQTGFRIAADTFIVRNEEPPQPTTALDDLAAVLGERGLQHVGVDFPLIAAIVYTELTLGLVSWALWAPDLARGEAAAAERAGVDRFLQDDIVREPQPETDFTAELGGARRIAGLPPALVLAVGVEGGQTKELEGVLPECRFVSRAFGTILPEACGSLVPNLILIDASADTGREFIMELRAAACGRTVPVVAITTDPLPLGADTTVDPAAEPVTWVEPIRQLLP